MYATDGRTRTDGRTKATLIAPFPTEVGHNKTSALNSKVYRPKKANISPAYSLFRSAVGPCSPLGTWPLLFLSCRIDERVQHAATTFVNFRLGFSLMRGAWVTYVIAIANCRSAVEEQHFLSNLLHTIYVKPFCCDYSWQQKVTFYFYYGCVIIIYARLSGDSW